MGAKSQTRVRLTSRESFIFGNLRGLEAMGVWER